MERNFLNSSNPESPRISSFSSDDFTTDSDDTQKTSVEKIHYTLSQLTKSTGINIANLQQYIASICGKINVDPKIATIIAQATFTKMFNVLQNANELAKLRNPQCSSGDIGYSSLPSIDFIVRNAEQNAKRGETFETNPISDEAHDFVQRIAAREPIQDYPPFINELMSDIHSYHKLVSVSDVIEALDKDKAIDPRKLLISKETAFLQKKQTS
ncbi:hypothetical protein GPJ56_009344 [Histomonas meleagridis]|uniref:uncharacterized protein n=1 Tax=Histomonas meleagridis TaxID=135588 RepID=UPI00355976BE|nr:hypothetical protein GPJ56_009344 [Histomonas meleagridis]KAH0797296.1 hypothetical protein GO595_009978 [Histomonas meleagridis]